MSDTTSAIAKLLKRSSAKSDTHTGLTGLDRSEKIAVATIEYHDGPVLLPNGMSIEDAIKLLKSREEWETTTVNITDTYDVFPWDGAHALDVVLTGIYGFTPATATPGFFGKTPPSLVRIAVGYKEFKEVPWGRFSLHGCGDGFLQTGTSRNSKGCVTFSMHAQVQRKDEAHVRKIFDMVRAYLAENSIYKGRAVKIRFRDDNGNALQMPEPEFIDTSHIDPNGLIFSDDINTSIDVNLFTPITRVHDLLKDGIPVKRGVLLGGKFGTGKTLAATVASKLAVDAGITYVYVPRADELPDALAFAGQYQSPACVVFCEDIDRAMDGERTVQIDDILNILDGMDTKEFNIITVLTTNNLNGITPAMLRPGRLDAVIEVTPPDAVAVEKLIRHYAGDTLDPSADLSQAGGELAGQIPAVIAEVVKRAKLAQVRLTTPGTPITSISPEAVYDAAVGMRAQLQLLHDRSLPPPQPPALDTVVSGLVTDKVQEVVAASMKNVHAKLDEIISNQ